MDLKKIKDDVQYNVTLTAAIEPVEGTKIYPGWDVVLRGDVIKREDIAPHVADATPVTLPKDV